MVSPSVSSNSSKPSNIAADFTDLLSGKQTPAIRASAAATIAAYSSRPKEARLLFPALPNNTNNSNIDEYLPESSISLLRALLRLTGEDSGKGTGRFVLSALVNFSEIENVALTLGKMGVIERMIEGMLDKEDRLTVLYAGLLSNCTRVLPVVKRYVERDDDKIDWNRGFRNVLKSLRGLPDSAVMFVGNVLVCEEGRRVVCEKVDGEGTVSLLEMSGVLDMIGEGEDSRRMAAVGVLRNLAKDVECLEFLVELHVVEKLLIRSVDGPKCNVKLEEVDGAGDIVLKAVGDKRRKAEGVKEIRLVICETLLLFCQAREGRDALRTRKAYPIIREWHLVEPEESIQDLLSAIVERIELVEEDGKAIVESEKEMKRGIS